MVSCLEYLRSQLQLYRVTGSEWAGPCPFCGGKDRFRVSAKTNKWWCRNCSPDTRWHNLADFLMRREGLTYAQAMSRLEGADVPQFSPPPERTVTPEQQEHWGRVTLDCQDSLFSAKGLRYLQWLKDSRGLSDNTIIEFRLGAALPRKGYEAAFVDQEIMPSGITIPLYAHDEALYGVKVRTNTPDKYRFLKGSKPCLYGPHNPTTDLLVTEGEFDAMLAWQETKGSVDVGTLGSAQMPLGPHWKQAITPYRRIFVVHDNDEEGLKSASWNVIGRAEHVRTPSAKDLTDYKETGDLSHWLNEVLTAPHVPKQLNKEEGGWQARKYAS